jgi:uncharacterized Ntn-hydrolase superfamily protein
MARAFEADTGAHIAVRLLSALGAGLEAGGEIGPVRSAALLVVHDQSFPLVDLRIDAADEPVAALNSLWQEYEPWMQPFVMRAIDPDNAGPASKG